MAAMGAEPGASRSIHRSFLGVAERRRVSLTLRRQNRQSATLWIAPDRH